MPHANRLTVGIMALVAEEEARDVREDQGGAGGGATRLQQLADALTARGVCAAGRGGLAALAGAARADAGGRLMGMRKKISRLRFDALAG